MLHTTITPAPTDRETAVAATSAGHLAALATVPNLTDLPTSLEEARQLTRSVKRYAGGNDLGMLGENGIEPAVRVCVDRARAAGFDWRERWAEPVPAADEIERYSTDAAYRSALDADTAGQRANANAAIDAGMAAANARQAARWASEVVA